MKLKIKAPTTAEKKEIFSQQQIDQLIQLDDDTNHKLLRNHLHTGWQHSIPTKTPLLLTILTNTSFVFELVVHFLDHDSIIKTVSMLMQTCKSFCCHSNQIWKTIADVFFPNSNSFAIDLRSKEADFDTGLFGDFRAESDNFFTVECYVNRWAVRLARQMATPSSIHIKDWQNYVALLVFKEKIAIFFQDYSNRIHCGSASEVMEFFVLDIVNAEEWLGKRHWTKHDFFKALNLFECYNLETESVFTKLSSQELDSISQLENIDDCRFGCNCEENAKDDVEKDHHVNPHNIACLAERFSYEMGRKFIGGSFIHSRWKQFNLKKIDYRTSQEAGCWYYHDPKNYTTARCFKILPVLQLKLILEKYLHQVSMVDIVVGDKAQNILKLFVGIDDSGHFVGCGLAGIDGKLPTIFRRRK